MNLDSGHEEEDSVERFALDLRSLKQEAGDFTLASLNVRTGISKSVLSEALSGKRLPTEKTVRYLVEALGQPRDGWIARRNALANGTSGRNGGARDAEHPVQRSSSVTRRSLVLASLASAVMAAIVTSAAWAGFLALRGSGSADLASSGTVAEELLESGDGVDPMRTVCREDAVIAASDVYLDGEVQVQLLYSNECQAVWGRVTRYDGQSAGNMLEMKVYPAADLNSSRNQERQAYDLQSIYTTMLIEPDVDARVCGIATISVDGETIELAPPICA